MRGNRRQQPPTSKNRLYRVGKDEVGGSNPPISSKKSCFLSKTGLFLYFLSDLICGSGCGSTLTHTLTHTRKCAERVKEERTEKSVVLKGLFFVYCGAEYGLSASPPHSLSRGYTSNSRQQKMILISPHLLSSPPVRLHSAQDRQFECCGATCSFFRGNRSCRF